MSSYQWKTGTNLSHDQRFKRKKWLEKNPDKTFEGMTYSMSSDFIGPRREDYVDPNAPTDPLMEEILDRSELEDKDQVVSGESESETTSTPVDYGEGATVDNWKKESSTGWTLNEMANERDKIKAQFGTNSPQYKNIQKAINIAYYGE